MLRRSYPQLRIGVDIGVTLRTITAIRAAGADEVVAGTSIFTADDPIRAYRDLARSFR